MDACTKPCVKVARARIGTAALILATLAVSCSTQAPAKGQAGLGISGKEYDMVTEKAVKVIAHRGNRSIAPENTILAARKGLEAGADSWELDVAASSDGILVVLHDDNLERTTDAALRYPGRKPWTVYDFTLAELRSLDAGSWYKAADPFGQIAAGRVGPEDIQSFAGLGLPTLEEALLFTKASGWRVNIEIKDATGRACDSWIVERTAQLVERLGIGDSILISSFNHDYLVRMKKAAPGLALAALVNRPIPDPVGLMKSLGAIAFHPNGKYLDKATVQALRSAGFDVNVWTVNERADMERLVSWGVTGLITDFPDLALEVLGRR
ncbi:MAG TPA: glycerophosphodiester phosphodiesterase family protein [Rectinemataceae bacterium]